MVTRSELKERAKAGDEDAAKKLEELRAKDREAKRRSRANIKERAKAGDKNAIKSLKNEQAAVNRGVKAYWKRIDAAIEAGDKEALATKQRFQANGYYSGVKNAILKKANLNDLIEIEKAIQEKRKQLKNSNKG